MKRIFKMNLKRKKPWTLTYILVLQTICSLQVPFLNFDQLNFPSKLKCHFKLAWISLGSSYKVPWSNLCDWSILLDPHLNRPWDNKNDSLQSCFFDLHMNSFPHYCSTAFPTPHFLKVTVRLWGGNHCNNLAMFLLVILKKNPTYFSLIKALTLLFFNIMIGYQKNLNM